MTFQKTVWGGLIILLVLPALYLGWRGFFGQGEKSLLSLGLPYLLTLFGNTLWVTAGGCILALIFGAGSAVLVSRFDFFGRKFLEAALCLPFALPPYLAAAIYNEIAHRYSMFINLGEAWDPDVSCTFLQIGLNLENVFGASLIFSFLLYPYIYLPLKITLRKQAAVYMETGKSLGMGPFQRFFKILIPLSAPSIIAGILLVSMEILSDYGTVNILGVRTLSVGIHDIWFIMGKPALAAQVSLFLLVICLMIFASMARYTSMKNFFNPSNRPKPGKRKKLSFFASVAAFFALLIPLCLGFVIPFAFLLYWCAGIINKARLGELYSEIWQTLLLAGLSTVFCLILALVFAFFRRSAGKNSLLSKATWTPDFNYVIPAIILAMAFLFLIGDCSGTFLSGFVSETIFFLAWACVARYLCFAHFTVESGMTGIPESLDQTIKTLGKTRIFALKNLYFPMLRPFIVMGGVLVFVSVLKELTMSLILQPFDYNTLATRAYSLAKGGMLKESSVYALCLVVLAAYPVFSIARWTGKED